MQNNIVVTNICFLLTDEIKRIQLGIVKNNSGEEHG